VNRYVNESNEYQYFEMYNMRIGICNVIAKSITQTSVPRKVREFLEQEIIIMCFFFNNVCVTKERNYKNGN